MSTRSRTPARPRRSDPRAPDPGRAWHRQPVVWLGAAVLAASLAGCAWLIVASQRYDDPPLPVDGLQILKMPLARTPAHEAAPPR